MKALVTDEASFWALLDKSGGAESCWPWKAGKDCYGYGTLTYQGKFYRAHRLAWILTYKYIPLRSMKICHHCDNPVCANPKHLFLGSQNDNVQDAVRKGRLLGRNAGERSSFHILTGEQVEQIRFLSKWYQQKELAYVFGCHRDTIGNIVREVCWQPKYLARNVKPKIIAEQLA